MIARKVWRKGHRSDVPDNHRYVKCKWVFTIKRNGVFRARLVVFGYSQFPGVDYSDSYSPVVHDIAFCALLLARMVKELSGKITGVKTAFLQGDLEEDIFIECPKEMDTESDSKILILDKCIYGLVQSARQYHKKAVVILKEIGFEGGEVGPCLYVRERN